MRGKHGEHLQAMLLPGITPADAGKTNINGVIELDEEDHPRGCGENLDSYGAWELPIGSPPRMRGKHHSTERLCNTPRITPADAGKTSSAEALYGGIKDHPRGCGENPRIDRIHRSGLGSPPRMRGKPSKCCCETLRGRITPADAGKTHRLLQKWVTGGDHPRGCGENT